MTFAEAREGHLRRLDADFAALRQIVADPLWCNDLYPQYKQAWERLEADVRRLRELNCAASAALDLPRE